MSRSVRKLFTVAVFTALILPAVALSLQQATAGQAPAAGAAQEGRGGARGGGRGGRGGAAPVNNPPPTSPVTGNAANGKTLYYQYSCYACHGYNGETGARPFVGRWGNLATEQGFIAFLRARADVAPAAPATNMPNFPANTLNDRQAKDIYAYIRTFKSNSPEAKDIQTFNAILDVASKPKK